VGHFERKFHGEWDVAHQRLLVSENSIHWAITWLSLHDPRFSRLSITPTCVCRRTDRQTDRHTTTASTALAQHRAG